MISKTIKELRPIFKALTKAEKVLGKNMSDNIRRRLVKGSYAEAERDFLQNRRRDDIAKELGMTRDEYEKSLE